VAIIRVRQLQAIDERFKAHNHCVFELSFHLLPLRRQMLRRHIRELSLEASLPLLPDCC
jgi:hypothetical protein